MFILPNHQSMVSRLESEIKEYIQPGEIKKSNSEALARYSEGRTKPTIQRYKGLVKWTIISCGNKPWIPNIA